MRDIKIPKGFIVFISGVPGTGKTTISYNLLKRHNDFRIVEETDLIREVLLGYNEYLITEYQPDSDFIKNINITDHNILLTLREAKKQCHHMKKSFEKIIERQQRKGIPTIINGVHIIPSVLNGICNNKNLIYINLYVNNETSIYNRIYGRAPSSYMLKHISLIYKTNQDLFTEVDFLSKNNEPYLFNNIDTTDLGLEETLKLIDKMIIKRTTALN